MKDDEYTPPGQVLHDFSVHNLTSRENSTVFRYVGATSVLIPRTGGTLSTFSGKTEGSDYEYQGSTEPLSAATNIRHEFIALVLPSMVELTPSSQAFSRALNGTGCVAHCTRMVSERPVTS